LVRDALALDPGLVRARIALGITLGRLGRHDEAEAAFHGALQFDPRSALAHHNLGELFRQLKRLQDARRAFQMALQLDPWAMPARIGLGQVLLDLREYREAADCFTQGIAASPNPVPILYQGLGTALLALGDHARSIDAFRRALAGNPESVEVRCDLAQTLLTMGDGVQALAALEPAIRRQPSPPAAERLYAVALAAQGDVATAIARLKPLVRPGTTAGDCCVFLAEKLYDFGLVGLALEVYREALDRDPHNASALHHFAALTHQKPDRPSDEYVREVFDRFADTFDQWLSGLEYSVPRHLVDALLAVHQSTARWNVLDLGCGTGLVGAAIAAHAERLVGVDLSSNMLGKARERKIYSRLLCMDLLSALHEQPSSCYDVVTAGDVFVYVGNLDSIVPAVRRALRCGGLFAFSVEALEDEAAGIDAAGATRYLLRESGRYAHAVEYLDDLARRNDFEVQLVRTVPLRFELNMPLMGRIIVWRATEAVSSEGDRPSR